MSSYWARRRIKEKNREAESYYCSICKTIHYKYSNIYSKHLKHKAIKIKKSSYYEKVEY